MTRDLNRTRNRGQDVTAWGLSDASNPAPIRIDEDGSVWVRTIVGSDIPQYVQVVDSAGVPVTVTDNRLETTNLPYGDAIAQGLYGAITPFIDLGFSPAIDTTLRTVWPYSATQAIYVFPTAEMGLEVVSSDNTQDIGTVIKGDATGDTVQADADGTTTTLEDDSVDFTAATAVQVGDCVILDPHGAQPEWGYVTAVAANTLTVAGGFSAGGSGASRYYAVLDYSAHTGAMAIGLHYLDADFAEREEIVVLNGTTVVATVNTDYYRLNGVHMVFAGSGNAGVGNISVRHLANTPVYGYITAGFTLGRHGAYTVPAGKTLYLPEWNISWSTPNDTKVQSARFRILVNRDPDHGFYTGAMFYPGTEEIVSNALRIVSSVIPWCVPAQTDIHIVGQAYTGGAGAATSMLRGYMVAG